MADEKKFIRAIRHCKVDDVKRLIDGNWSAAFKRDIVRESFSSDFETFQLIHKKFGDSSLSPRQKLSMAATGGDLDIFKFLLQDIKITDEIIEISLGDALRAGSDEIYKYIIDKYQDEVRKLVLSDNKTGLFMHSVHDPDILELFLSWEADPVEAQRDYSGLLEAVLKYGSLRSFDLVMKKMAPTYQADLTKFFRIADKRPCSNMFFYLMDRYPEHKVDIQKKLVSMIMNAEISHIEEAVKRGAIITHKMLMAALDDDDLSDELVRVKELYSK